MKTALAPPIIQTDKPLIASLLPAPVPQPQQAAHQIKLTPLQTVVGNLAIQRAVAAAPAGEAGTAGVAVELPIASVAKTPANAKEDPAHQAVVTEMGVKAKRQRTPTKTPEDKRDETVLAAKEESRPNTNISNAYENYLGKLDKVQSKDLTVPEFMAEFMATIKKLETKVPTNDSVDQRVIFVAEQEMAKQDVANQGKSHSEPLREESSKDPRGYADNKKEEATGYRLELDPAGNVPSIPQAKAAAPKPEPDKAVSLDDKSRELDEAFQNHDVGGQKIDIDEGSLPFTVSGEKSFDEAGETKRQAQIELAKAKPKYRQEEKAVITKSEMDIHALVNVRGLQQNHNLRAQGFGNVLGEQVKHKAGILSAKQPFLERVDRAYNAARRGITAALNSLQADETIDQTFENITTEADEWFKWWTREKLEYVYPGFWEYSDFFEDHKGRILAEYKRLLGDKYHDVDEALEHLSTKFKTLGDIGKRLPEIGVGDVGLFFKAVDTVQAQVALEYFEVAKTVFIARVLSNVEKRIARRVVIAINQARRAIEKGKADVDEAYKVLTPKEQQEVADVYEAAKSRFDELRKSVDERQHEIINDMARSYNTSVGKLKAEFDEIKKDVQTIWLEKAWNKIKAVINAIIDFATRIAELLGRVAYLLGDIVSSPRAFFSNLITGIKEGFSTFAKRIEEFLATAFFDWLRGSSGVQVQLPKEWNAAGIFSLFTQLLDLSLETVWQRMEVVYDKTIANAFRQGEVVAEKGLEIFDIIRKDGLGGLWDYIVESLGTLLSDTLDEIKETILYAAIKKVLLEIGKLLVPGGGFIAIAEKIIRLLVFIVEARDKILDLIDAFVSSMENAVKGDIAGIVKLITIALTRFITLALDFLLSFFGLSNLKEKVQRFIQRMRSPVIRGIDFVLQKFKPLVMKGKELLVKGKEKAIGVVKVGVSKVLGWLGVRKRFRVNGETHSLSFDQSATTATLLLATTPVHITSWLKSRRDELRGANRYDETKERAYTAIQNDLKTLERLTYTPTATDSAADQEKIATTALDSIAANVATIGFSGDIIPVPQMVATPGFSSQKAANMTVQFLFGDKSNHRPGVEVSGREELLGAWTKLAELGISRMQWKSGHMLHKSFGGLAENSNLIPIPTKVNNSMRVFDERVSRELYEQRKPIWMRFTIDRGHPQDTEHHFVSYFKAEAAEMPLREHVYQTPPRGTITFEKSGSDLPYPALRTAPMTLNELIASGNQTRSAVAPVAGATQLPAGVVEDLVKRGTKLKNVDEIADFIRSKRGVYTDLQITRYLAGFERTKHLIVL